MPTSRLFAALEGSLEIRIGRDMTVLTKSMRGATQGQTLRLKQAARDVVNQRFSGSSRVRGGNRRVANTIRHKFYDDGEGKYAGQVYSKFGKGRGRDFQDYLLPHVRGDEIRGPGWAGCPYRWKTRRV